jgi:hypothetical protein
MKDLKSKNTTKQLLILSMFIMLLFISCKKDKTSEMAVREDFIGLWQCEEFDNNNQLMATFQVEIIADPVNEENIYLDNFNLLGSGFQLEAETSNGQITILPQSLAGNSYSGSGVINDNLTGLEMQYLVEDAAGTSENVRASFMKL